ncbi:hypothetical protein RSOL_080890 [Rhizoctonia solani AG-3 Rhs1AP]|uniref:Uncharacterized protein n=1 Tax=Rhizoctonia solani AG-3 Rhs1AP TaxID=1086054 RepID=X8IZ78_9AGAM|nr:hypothetical protein RSOL_080890 [Rhizoctonia solani AG-3 Rhs1AP]
MSTSRFSLMSMCMLLPSITVATKAVLALSANI